MAKDTTITESKRASDGTLDNPTSTKEDDPSLPSPNVASSEESGYNTEKNPFVNPEAAEHWRQVYEKSQYECWYIYDPTLTWIEEEEKKVVRKLD